MNKPESVAVNDFRAAVEAALKESGLSPAVLESLLQNYWRELRDAAARQTLQDAAAWRKEKEHEDL